ncbi:MAG TPA: hypothetical protein VKV27_16485 [Solirubrobacteraceae bacterium]|nr:hypothetical protein [Solirubrobacteraceae bacterium]
MRFVVVFPAAHAEFTDDELKEILTQNFKVALAREFVSLRRQSQAKNGYLELTVSIQGYEVRLRGQFRGDEIVVHRVS